MELFECKDLCPEMKIVADVLRPEKILFWY
jgi:hypothetical protein